MGPALRPVPLNTRLENDLPALLKAVNGQTIAVNLVNPHNPSGTVNDTAALDVFIREASKHTLVVVDEAYLEYDNLAARSAVRHVREGANVLVFRTLAKIYGLAGLSIGYALAPAQLAADLRKASIGSPHSLNRLALVAAAAALDDQAYVAGVRKTVTGERDRISAGIDRLGWQRTDSRANFVFFRPPDVSALRRSFEASGIAVGRPFEPLAAWVRVTIGTAIQNKAVLNVIRST